MVLKSPLTKKAAGRGMARHAQNETCLQRAWHAMLLQSKPYQINYAKFRRSRKFTAAYVPTEVIAFIIIKLIFEEEFFDGTVSSPIAACFIRPAGHRINRSCALRGIR
jgi:hypothetical protein